MHFQPSRAKSGANGNKLCAAPAEQRSSGGPSGTDCRVSVCQKQTPIPIFAHSVALVWSFRTFSGGVAAYRDTGPLAC